MPNASARIEDPARHVGRYGNRQTTIEVATDDAGRLWQTVRMRASGLEMADRAGFTPTVDRFELRPLAGETFVRVTGAGEAAGTVVFGDPNAAGRRGIVADDRVAARR